ncbi:MAG: hypothetical protein AAF408_07420 [Pseudomonadota bacterium]
MGTPSPPAPPDPNVTASAQTATNIGTAVANTAGGQVNQITPYGSLTYDQTGTYQYVDPLNGRTHDIPTYTATTELSPEAQFIHDQNLGAQAGLAETANQQATFLRDYLGEPATFDTAAIEDRLSELGRARLDPRFAEEEDALRTRLANQGIGYGSEIYDRQMGDFQEYKNDAYNQLALQGRSQAFGEIAAQRNQPINEISALLSGSQVAAPQFSIANPAQAPTVDYAGLVQQDYANRLGAWQQQANSRNSLMGGLFRLAGGLGSAAITGGLF